MMDFQYPLRCWAACCGSPSQRSESASGGIAYALGLMMLDSGGLVYGAAWTEKNKLEIIKADSLSDLSAFRGSKYVQSQLRKDTLDDLERALLSGKKVLFIALPCQITSIKARFGDKYRSQLFLIDLLCHGVPPERFLKEELEYLSKGRDYDRVQFRGNSQYDFHLSLWDGKNCIYDCPADKQAYFAAYLWGLGLKEACYSCKYARKERLGDLSLGDYIGFGRFPLQKSSEASASLQHTSSNTVIPRGNISFVSANTPEGEALIMQLKDYVPKATQHGIGDLWLIERDYAERLLYPYSLSKATPRHPADKRFRRLLPRYGYALAVRKALRWEFLRRRVVKAYISLKRKLGINGPIFRKRRVDNP